MNKPYIKMRLSDLPFPYVSVEETPIPPQVAREKLDCMAQKDAQIAQLREAVQLALDAFERNDCIDWSVLNQALKDTQ